MDELDIKNPHAKMNYKISSDNLKKHILAVVNTYPSENKIIKNENNNITIFKPFVDHSSGLTPNDRILYIKTISTGISSCEVDYEITNQFNKISSYSEQEMLIKTMTTFVALIEMSIKGILKLAAATQVNKAQNTKSLSAIVSFITLIVAIYAIFIGMKGCSM